MPFTPAIEPMIPSDSALERTNLPALAMELERRAARLEGSLSPVSARVLEAHVRVLNSYYSNLIEGNSTHPHDIRQAMQGHYSNDPVKRDLQMESLAHVDVQGWLAREGVSSDRVMRPAFLCELHRRFYQGLPEHMLRVRGEDGLEQMLLPGRLRQSEEGVIVGRHIAPSGAELEGYLERFTEAYRLDRLHGHRRVIAAMAAHHRLLWIHPFLDGNGRVARLHVDTVLRVLSVGASGVWCVSRGLARQNSAYKAALGRADEKRLSDRDGRGALSEQRLVEFCDFMLHVALDQVSYMTEVLQLRGMRERIRAYIADRNRGMVREVGKIKPEAARLLERAFIEGEFPRRESADICGLSASVTRKLVQQLKVEGLLTEASSRSPLRWAIPEHAERYYFPDL